MKLHIWTDMLSYLAVAHADSVSDARRLLLEESDLGESGDGSCPEIDKARCAILGKNPEIYIGKVAEFSLSDNAQLREMEGYVETLRQQVAARDRQVAELEAAISALPHQEHCEVWNAKEFPLSWATLYPGRTPKCQCNLSALDAEGFSTLDAALAAAKREALEAAASRAEETTGVLTDEELRRMAREVK